MDKRTFLKTVAMAGAGALVLGQNPIQAVNLPNTSAANDPLPFPQPPLNYPYDALEPFIDARTMEIHYSKHHATYTKNFNTAVMDLKLQGKSIADIFQNISKYPPALRNQGGGYFNHNLYWSLMAPNAGGEPSGKLAQQISNDFGSFDKFKDIFSKAATGLFGSGWTWLIIKDNKLQIITTPNQDNPLMDVATVQGVPVLTLDVWEHAYYLKYQNRRAEYITAFWNVVNWKQAESNFLQA